MKRSKRRATTWSVWILIIGFLAPSLIIFCLEVFVGGVSPSVAVADVFRRQFAEGHNLVLLAFFGLIPFVALSIVCFCLGGKLANSRLSCVVAGGLLGILALMIPSHVSVWYPLYTSGHASSSSVIAFLFIPFYCLGTLCIGLLACWLISLFPYFRDQPTSIKPNN